ncbi:phosphatase PAP2 family protein [Variovorax sp. J22G21]|uniref:phosphatase PAP2 family protein n=1 Tax=Variovorax fucosicus TaxID=3053517 RepID=UPI002578A83C|nr:MULTISPECIES: phosphatase PAP2 family protein [unclassified Variovorax]MDM0038962.1 phosphatase PAP2 family protein [Variovorax sp. J22R193]MDM0063738.1 phosphatase PAP2 family protein [Variovorax sp. J22G21]
MNALNLTLFHWLTAGSDPVPWLLSVAGACALWGSWLSAAILLVTLWRYRADRAYVCIVAAAAGLTSLLSHAIAMSLDLPRPFALGLAPAYIAHGGRGSLPSTHAAVMFMVALAFTLRPTLRRWGGPLLALAAITGWARVYVGVHFPLDIAAGLLLGALIAGAVVIGCWLVHFFTLRMQRHTGTREAGSPWRHS